MENFTHYVVFDFDGRKALRWIRHWNLGPLVKTKYMRIGKSFVQELLRSIVSVYHAVRSVYVFTTVL